MRKPLATLLLGLVSLLGCSDEAAERRARAAAEKVKESMPDVHAVALAQPVSAEDVRAAQAALAQLREYQGEVNGKLDTVTINAVQAFQRSQGLDDDGILDEDTRLRLQAAAR